MTRTRPPTEEITMVTPSSSTVPSADSTPITVERRGAGRPLVLIGGAFNDAPR